MAATHPTPRTAMAMPSLDLPDHLDPTKFSPRKKARIVAIGIAITINSALGSSLPSGATSEIGKAFSVSSSLKLVLMNSLYLLGFAVGPLIFGPLSEHIGRRFVLIGTYIGYIIFTVCCAVSPNYSALLVFRLLVGTVASTANAVVGPLYADIYNDPVSRGRSMSYFICVTSMIPPFGPIISGYSAKVTWRLAFWIGVAIAGVLLPLVLSLPETYAPVIRRRWLRERPDEHEVAAGDNAPGMLNDVMILFTRPFTMLIQEPVVLLSSLYLALVYSILYLFFQAYPIMFGAVYDLSAGEVGLAFLPVTGGAVVGLGIFFWYSAYHASAVERGSTWATKIEYRRLPLACIGGPMVVVSLFWLGWTSRPSIHVAVPALSGLLFGTGSPLLFIALINYMADAYRQFSASALSAASTTRSITAVCLPLAAPRMYESLGIPWACSLLGFFTLGLAVVPFVFIRYGDKIRANSPFCQKLAALDF